jgi:membrane protein
LTADCFAGVFAGSAPSLRELILMPSLWKFGGLTPLALARQVFTKFDEDEILTRSSSLAYYFMLALFPMLLFLVSLLGMIAAPRAEFREAVVSTLGRLAPGDAAGLIRHVLDQTVRSSGGLKLGFGILGALWAASGGMAALVVALNVINRVQETRSFLRLRLTVVGLTLALAILVLIAVALVLYGGEIGRLAASDWVLGRAFLIAWKIAEWAVSLGCMFLSFSLIYYFAPSIEERHWFWVTPGALLGVCIWLVASVGFRIYLHFFNSYSATYGFVGGVIILMLWLYLTGMAILTGAEINSVIELSDKHAAEFARKRRQIEQKLGAA